MKQFILTVAMATATLLLAAQSADSIPDPEFINQVFAWGKDHKLMPLEKKRAEIVTKNKMGIGGAKQMYQLDGANSSVSVSTDNTMFVVSTANSGGFGMDPSQQFMLMKFESRKDKREAVSAQYGGMMKKQNTNQAGNEIGLNYKQIREGVYGIMPEKPLEKGQYAFINKMSAQTAGMSMRMEAYAFSVQ